MLKLTWMPVVACVRVNVGGKPLSTSTWFTLSTNAVRPGVWPENVPV